MVQKPSKQQMARKIGELESNSSTDSKIQPIVDDIKAMTANIERILNGLLPAKRQSHDAKENGGDGDTSVVTKQTNISDGDFDAMLDEITTINEKNETNKINSKIGAIMDAALKKANNLYNRDKNNDNNKVNDNNNSNVNSINDEKKQSLESNTNTDTIFCECGEKFTLVDLKNKKKFKQFSNKLCDECYKQFNDDENKIDIIYCCFAKNETVFHHYVTMHCEKCFTKLQTQKEAMIKAQSLMSSMIKTTLKSDSFKYVNVKETIQAIKNACLVNDSTRLKQIMIAIPSNEAMKEVLGQDTAVENYAISANAIDCLKVLCNKEYNKGCKHVWGERFWANQYLSKLAGNWEMVDILGKYICQDKESSEIWKYMWYLHCTISTMINNDYKYLRYHTILIKHAIQSDLFGKKDGLLPLMAYINYFAQTSGYEKYLLYISQWSILLNIVFNNKYNNIYGKLLTENGINKYIKNMNDINNLTDNDDKHLMWHICKHSHSFQLVRVLTEIMYDNVITNENKNENKNFRINCTMLYQNDNESILLYIYYAHKEKCKQ